MNKVPHLDILTVSALYPPHIIGGAEIIAAAVDEELQRVGNDVYVLSTTTDAATRTHTLSTLDNGIELNRLAMPRPYTALNYAPHPAWQKALWHMQDHFDPRNESLWARYIDQVKPDVALIHVLQGLGFNGLKVLAERDIPTVIVLHDLSLACIKTSMFADGKTCTRQCTPCQLSSKVKMAYANSVPRLGFVSPSMANLSRAQALLPIAGRPSKVIYNPAKYPAPHAQSIKDGVFRLLYVGQISPQKGVEFLIETVIRLAQTHRVELTVLGDGPQRADLEARFGNLACIHFMGAVSLQAVADHMAQSDLLCTPSLWFENLPGVIIQALCQGLPVVASDTGGIPELVTHNVNGQLFPPGNAESWYAGLAAIIEAPDVLGAWSNNARAGASRFSPEQATESYLSFMHTIIDS